jgi:hypothetical protein
MTMEELITIFTNMKRYIPYLKEEKTKVQRFISFLPQIYRDKLDYDNPKTLDEAIRKEKLCYKQLKQRGET